ICYVAIAQGAVYVFRVICISFFFFSSRRRHTRFSRDWSSDVCSSDLKSSMRRNSGPGAPGSASARTRERIPSQPTRKSARSSLQIGRASCRERVENWMVAVELKKKKEEMQGEEGEDEVDEDRGVASKR